MKITDKIKSYSFWVSLASAVILILKLLGNRFGFTVDETMISDLFTALCSVLVLLGIIVVPNTQANSSSHNLTQDISKNDAINNDTSNLNDLNKTIEIVSTNNIVECSEEDEKINNEKISDTLQIEVLDNTISDENTDEKQDNIQNKLDNELVINNIETYTKDCNEEQTQEIQIEQLSENSTNSFTAIDSLKEESNVDPYNNDIIELQAINNDSFKIPNPEVYSDIDLNTAEQNPNHLSELKELLNLKRAEFSKNINDYILELQEEIRKAREQM